MKLLYTIANALQRRSKIPVSDGGMPWDRGSWRVSNSSSDHFYWNLNWAIVEFAGRKIPPFGEIQGMRHAAPLYWTG